ncbi:MAG: tetratricopeptide repeat protein [candidate division WOR-3 bacterium]
MTNLSRKNLLIKALMDRAEVYDLTGTKKLLATIYGLISQYDGMFNSAQESLKLYEELNERKGIGENLNKIGLVYSRFGKYDRALEYYNKSLKIREEIGDRRGRAAVIPSQAGPSSANS